MKKIFLFYLIPFILVDCSTKSNSENDDLSCYTQLKDTLSSYIENIPARIGVALVTDKDTLTINNDRLYPMMSVFKLHQAIAVAMVLDADKKSFDSEILVDTDTLDANTWSPMLNDYKAGKVNISIGRLIEYSVSRSDNNASNLLFNHIAGPGKTDSIVKSIAIDSRFNICFTEEEMAKKHSLSYENNSTPLSCALLLRNLFVKPVLSKSSLNVIQML